MLITMSMSSKARASIILNADAAQVEQLEQQIAQLSRAEREMLAARKNTLNPPAITRRRNYMNDTEYT